MHAKRGVRRSRLFTLGLFLTLPTLVLLTTAVGGSWLLDRLVATKGPIPLWFRGWDAEVPISDVATKQEIVLKAEGRQPTVVGLYVDGECDGEAKLTLTSLKEGLHISLPDEMHRLHVYDWYGSDFVVAYVPGSATRGNLVVKVKFGY